MQTTDYSDKFSDAIEFITKKSVYYRTSLNTSAHFATFVQGKQCYLFEEKTVSV